MHARSRIKSKQEIPVCYFPIDYDSYVVDQVKTEPQGIQVKMTMGRPSPYPRNIPNVLAQFHYLSNSVLSIRVGFPLFDH